MEARTTLGSWKAAEQGRCFKYGRGNVWSLGTEAGSVRMRAKELVAGRLYLEQ